MIPEKILFLFLCFTPVLINFGIAFYVFYFLPRNRTITIFGFLVIAIALWQIEDILLRLVPTLDAAYNIDKFLCFSWISAAPLSFHFACRYASLKIIENRLLLLAIYLPFFILQRIYVSNYQSLFTYQEDWGWVMASETGIIDVILRFWISITTLATIIIILRHAYTVGKNKELKFQAFLIAAGILIPTIGGLVTQVALPFLLRHNEIPITSTFFTFFSFAVILSLKEYRLFDISESIGVETVLQNLKKIVLVVSPGEKVLYMNPYTKGIFNCDDNAIQHFSFRDTFISQASYNDFVTEVLKPAMEGHSVKNFAIGLLSYKSQQIDVLLTAEPIVNNNYIQGVLIVGNDITEYLNVLKELKESNERYELISKATNDMVWDWDLLTGVMYRNKEGWKRLFKNDLVDDIDKKEEWATPIHPEDQWKAQHLKKQLEDATAGDFFELEFRVLKEDGSIIYLLNRGYVVKNEHGKPIRLIGAAQDITKRKETEQRLEEERLRKHKEITDATIIAQENERRVIGAELHDNVNQILTSAILYLNLSRTEVNNKDQFLEQTSRMVKQAMNEVRRLSHSLIPPSLSGETLVEAIVHLLEAAEKMAMFVVHKNLEDFSEKAVSNKLKLDVYRIIQEQLNNIIKHAKASSVVVTLWQQDKQICLSIEDDGIGFVASKRSKGVGLTNIETRAFLHGGRIEIISAPNKGCTLRVVFPITAL